MAGSRKNLTKKNVEKGKKKGTYSAIKAGKTIAKRKKRRQKVLKETSR